MIAGFMILRITWATTILTKIFDQESNVNKIYDKQVFFKNKGSFSISFKALGKNVNHCNWDEKSLSDEKSLLRSH